MLITVTTLKDSIENVRRFVIGNLAGGADHLVIFAEAPTADVVEYLSGHPQVTLVVSDGEWWGAKRPVNLNRRQNIGANAALHALRKADPNTWVFHVDGDEILRVDRNVLDGLGPEISAVGVTPLEVVGQVHPPAPPTLFKRLLTADELSLLQTLGHLAEATNSLYFRSHIVGKVGVRASSNLRLGIHKAVHASGERAHLHRDPGLRLLHLESYSGEEFERKWSAMVGSGPQINFGTARMVVARGLRSLLSMNLDQATRQRYLHEIYQRHMADPVDTLNDLGLLEEIDVFEPGHTPLPSERVSALLERELDELRGVNKFHLVPPAKTRRPDTGNTPGIPEEHRYREPRTNLLRGVYDRFRPSGRAAHGADDTHRQG